MSRMRRLVSGNKQRWLPIRLGLLVAIMLAAAFAVSAAVFLLLAWVLPTAFNFEKKPFEVLKVVIGVVGSIGAVFALTVAYRKQQINERTNEREDTRLFNERFGAASAQLASDKPAERLAGVHALAGLADDWDSGRQTCIDVLCAYMTLPPSKPDPPDEPDTNYLRKDQSEWAEERVRDTVMDTVANKLRQEPSESSWHGHTFRFVGARLKEFDFSAVTLTKDTHLDFSYADLQLGVNLDSAIVDGARISFRGTIIQYILSFKDAAISASYLDFDYANLTDCWGWDTHRASLRDTEISLIDIECDKASSRPIIDFHSVKHMDRLPQMERYPTITDPGIPAIRFPTWMTQEWGTTDAKD